MHDVRDLLAYVGGGVIYRLHVTVHGIRVCVVVRYSYQKHVGFKLTSCFAGT